MSKYVARQVRFSYKEAPPIPISENRPVKTKKIIQLKDVRINVADIICIKANGNLMHVTYLNNNKKGQIGYSWTSLKALAQYLDDPCFFSEHRSYILNLHFFERIIGDTIHLKHIPPIKMFRKKTKAVVAALIALHKEC